MCLDIRAASRSVSRYSANARDILHWAPRKAMTCGYDGPAKAGEPIT